MDTLREHYCCQSLNMIVELTNACNLRCKYCFENNQTEERKCSIMRKEILKKCIDFLVADRENSHLTFFGGEPLLCKDLIKFGIKYGNKIAREKKKYIAYSVVTNGTELDDDFISVLNDNNVNVIYSFDGNKFSQNKYRPFTSGKGSYDVVVGNLKKFLKTRKDERYGHLIIRPTITSDTIELMNGIYKDLIELGCKEISFSLVSAEENKDYAIKKGDLEKLSNTYGEMIEIYYSELSNHNSYNKFFESILERIETNAINKEFCDCGKRYIAVDVNGNVYPCEGFIGIEEFRMGNIMSERFDNCWIAPKNVEENQKCKECWARYLCGGSCYHEAWMRTGDINNRDELVCETYKMAFDYALKLYTKLKEENLYVKKIVNEPLLPTKSIPVTKKSILKKLDNSIFYVVDGINNRFITLNETAQRIFELCNGINTILDIYNIIISEYECESDVYFDISEIINSFLEEGIIKLTI